MRIKVMQVGEGTKFPLPQYQTEGAAGFDLIAALGPDEHVYVAPGGVSIVPTGLAIALPPGYEAQVRPRSGLAAKHGVTVLNAPGTIDSDYRGEIKAILINHGHTGFTIRPGDRIAQLVIAKYERVTLEAVESLDATARGDGGFGSTGIGTKVV